MPLLTTMASVIGAAACAIILHTADDRGGAVWIVPIALIWGSLAVAGGRRGTAHTWWMIWIAALLCRAPLIGTPALLSDDLFRYLFEGQALAAGFNPFVHPPASLVGLDDALLAQVNHPDVPTVYPPLALWWFRLLALGGQVAHVQGATALVDSFVPLALVVASRRAWPGWIYALHPLPVLESACGGHIDVPAVALAIAGVAAWRRGHRDLAWWGLAAGGWTKILPFALLPPIWRRLSRTRRWRLPVATLVATAILAWPVLGGGQALTTGLGAYASHWSFNGFLYGWLAPLGSGVRPVLVSIGGAVALAAWWRHTDPGAAWASIGAGFVLLSPTVHPWYVLWAMVPALACGRWGWAAAGVPMIASYTVLLAYDPTTGQWSEAPWVWWITWPPALVLLLIASIGQPRRRSPSRTATGTAGTPRTPR